MPVSIRIGVLAGFAYGYCSVRASALEEPGSAYRRARQAAGRLASRLCRVSFLCIKYIVVLLSLRYYFVLRTLRVIIICLYTNFRSLSVLVVVYS